MSCVSTLDSFKSIIFIDQLQHSKYFLESVPAKGIFARPGLVSDQSKMVLHEKKLITACKPKF